VGSGAPALIAAADRGEARARAVTASGVLAAARAAIAAGAVPVEGAAVRPLYVRAADAVPRAA